MEFRDSWQTTGGWWCRWNLYSKCLDPIKTQKIFCLLKLGSGKKLDFSFKKALSENLKKVTVTQVLP